MLLSFPYAEDFPKKRAQELDNSDPCDRTKWMRKHPKNWTHTDVLDWVFYVVEQKQIDGSKFHGEAYRHFTGPDLCQMNKAQFQSFDPVYGATMYDTFQHLLGHANSERFVDSIPVGHIEAFMRDSTLTSNLRNDSSNQATSGVRDSNNNFTPCTDLVVFRADNDIKVDLPNLGTYPIGPDIELPLTPLCFTPPIHPPSPSQIPNLPFLMSSSTPSTTSQRKTRTPPMSPRNTTISSKSPGSSHGTNSVPQQNASSCSSSIISSPSISVASSSSKSHTLPLRMSPIFSPPRCSIDSSDIEYSSDDSTLDFSYPYLASPANDAFVNDADDVGINDTAKRALPTSDAKKQKNVGATKSRNQLYQFVSDLLRDPNTNPRLLKWEDKEDGVFRFVQSETVAKLWGVKKKNPHMTYEKMSRAMRFCRCAGYFESVPRTGKFPKRLCFKFGGKAQGWRD